MVEPTTLHIDSTVAPLFWASLSAAKVSAVSPLCDIVKTNVFEPIMGFL